MIYGDFQNCFPGWHGHYAYPKPIEESEPAAKESAVQPKDEKIKKEEKDIADSILRTVPVSD